MDTGIGYVRYVDTSCKTHETSSGAIYFNTSESLPGIQGVSQKNCDRTDDPLGADSEKLCYTDKPIENYVEELVLSGTYETVYEVGDAFDPTGMEFSAKWKDGTTEKLSTDKITFTGYPTEDGSGSSFGLQMPMAISSVTKYPDAAWDFVCSIIKKMNTIDENNYYYGFPISQAAFDAEMTDIMTEQYQLDENGEQVDWDGDGEPDKVIRGGYETMENGERVYKDVYALTQEDIDQILGVINSTRSVYDYDQEILDIITDEVAAYFAGDKDVQTTANMIQSRVNLYVQEQR
mgnify:CR=1 FL=1